MTRSETPGLLKRFRRTPWRFQQTFYTPLQSLRLFAETIVAAHAPLQAASVIIDEFVFEPKHLLALTSRYSLPPKFNHDCCLGATGPQEIAVLLEATLSDWIDFVFVPTPKPFVIYADHDEYTTFYANTKSNLNRLIQALSAAGFEQVPDYERNF